jgi:flagellar biosynthesis/type III secretory pathway M-ring protein FliF/YscJ
LPEWLGFLPEGVPLWAYGAAAGSIVLLLAMAFFLWRRKRRAKVSMAPSAPAIPAAAGHATPHPPVLTEGMEASGSNLESFIQEQQERLKLKEHAALASLKGVQPRAESAALTAHLVETVNRDPAGAAQVLRSWLTEDRR